jgi:retron-type reverse transcriptase
VQNIQQKSFTSENGCKINIELFNTALEQSKKNLGGVFTIVDISKAFDTVPNSAIAPSLARKGISARLMELINKTYKETKTTFKTKNGIGVKIEILRGVKQGDPLSPTLFNLCLEPMLEAVEEFTEGININNNNKMAFADDIVLIGKDKREAQKKLSMV